MRMVDIIRKKRDRQVLTEDEIRFFVTEYKEGRIPDYQAAALLMAIWLNGMNEVETFMLTEQMLHSGELWDWSDLPGVKADKHSTGGVGDKTSLIMAPIVACAGLRIPMISGRGLGHTGGTLDKLQSIPGFGVDLDRMQFRRILRKTGLAYGGQTANIAPVDKKLYALRDVTGTVESIPLITSSILSKKLAEGIDALVLDVKVGSGAFMKKPAQAKRLAELLVKIGSKAGKKVVALVTDMDEPLGTHVGNTLEVVESVQVLAGDLTGELAELSVELAAQLLVMGGVCKQIQEAKKKVYEIVSSGEALRKFMEVVKAQGGDPQTIENPSRLPWAKHTDVLQAQTQGFIKRLDAERVGIAAMVLGAGRLTVEDQIDPGAGLILHKKVGHRVEKGQPLATMYTNDKNKFYEARKILKQAFMMDEKRPVRRKLIRKVLS